MADPVPAKPDLTITAKLDDTVTLTFTCDDPNTHLVSLGLPDKSGKPVGIDANNDSLDFKMPDVSTLPDGAKFCIANLERALAPPPAKGSLTYFTSSNTNQSFVISFEDVGNFDGRLELQNLKD
jgi:hypothetical protein